MPDFGFYAVNDDLRIVAEATYDLGFSVFESYSEFEQNLRHFKNSEQLVNFWSSDKPSPLVVQLYHPSFGGPYRIEKIEVIPDKCRGYKFRYNIVGWGLIILELGLPTNNTLANSRIACNSETRAKSWEATHPELGACADWNWKSISQLFKLLKTRIKDSGAIKVDTMYVLPSANQMYQRGFHLGG